MSKLNNGDYARIAHHLDRVLLIEPTLGAAKLTCSLLKGMGAGCIETAETLQQGWASAETLTPQLVITEHQTPGVDAALFTHRLRRSSLSCRKAPVLVITADATAEKIKAVRDAGAHEFLKKPFTAQDLFRRIDNMVGKPRTWIEAIHYVGPCRRRFNSGAYAGPRRRGGDIHDLPTCTAQAVLALKIMQSSIDNYRDDPAQALRSIHAQMHTLTSLAANTHDRTLAAAIRSLRLPVDVSIRAGERPQTLSDSALRLVIEAAAAADKRTAA